MFNAVLIHANPDRSALLRAMVAATGQMTIVRELMAVPNTYELVRILNTTAPDVIVIDLASGDLALDCCARIAEHSVRSAVVGFGATSELTSLARRVGFHALVPAGGHVEDLQLALHDAIHVRHGGIEPGLYSFLPSKAGSGASTVVINTAVALAHKYKKRVLVVDADLRSGILAIMLNVEPRGSIQNLFSDIQSLDHLRLRDCVVPLFGVDFLFSSRSLDAGLPEWSHYYHLLNLVRESYDAVLVDLPELVNTATVELVRRSTRVFPVCTPEIPSLRLTQHRCTELERWGVSDDRIGLLVNRWHHSDMAPADITKLLGKPVFKAFPNDYALVREAVSAGSPVALDSRLGRAFLEFAAHLADAAVEEPKSGLAGKLKGLFGRG